VAFSAIDLRLLTGGSGREAGMLVIGAVSIYRFYFLHDYEDDSSHTLTYIFTVNASGINSNVAGKIPIGSPSTVTVTSLSFDVKETFLTCL
jgi:hypothetical protein